MVVKFLKMAYEKTVCILLQVLTALAVIKFFPYKFVPNEGLNNLIYNYVYQSKV